MLLEGIHHNPILPALASPTPVQAARLRRGPAQMAAHRRTVWLPLAATALGRAPHRPAQTAIDKGEHGSCRHEQLRLEGSSRSSGGQSLADLGEPIRMQVVRTSARQRYSTGANLDGALFYTDSSLCSSPSKTLANCTRWLSNIR